MESVKQLLVEVTTLCQKTSLALFERHFKRFAGLLILLQEKTKDELAEI